MCAASDGLALPVLRAEVWVLDQDAVRAEVADLAPELVARNSIGRNGAAQLLLTAGDNPEQLRSEAGFAALCVSIGVEYWLFRTFGAVPR